MIPEAVPEELLRTSDLERPSLQKFNGSEVAQYLLERI
jgi:hypothetical protein